MVYFEGQITNDRSFNLYASIHGRLRLCEFFHEHFEGDVVDLGCGKGNSLQEIGYHAKNKKVIGVDYEQEEASNIIHADFSNIPLETGSIGRVISSYGIGYYAESLKDLQDHFKEVRRILNAGGKIMMVVATDQFLSKFNDNIPRMHLSHIQALQEINPILVVEIPSMMSQQQMIDDYLKDEFSFKINLLHILNFGFEIVSFKVTGTEISLELEVGNAEA